MNNIQVGSVSIAGQTILAPMAGFTDLPYRKICRQWGAAYAVAEMAASKDNLQHTAKTSFRMNLDGEPSPRGIQLIGSVPEELARAAKRAENAGADIVDLNCGCPAKKVCSVACGSALLKNPDLVESLLQSIVNAVSVPVTLKYRIGWSTSDINAVDLGKRAEDAGVKMLVLHGRTGEQGFKGHAEYETIRRLKQAVSIPVIANGDIDAADKALEVLKATGADGVMIGRGALGNPWIFSQINSLLSGTRQFILSKTQIEETIIGHIRSHHAFYGEVLGLKTIRTHLNWYLKRFNADEKDIRKVLLAGNPDEQIDLTLLLLERLDLSINLL